MYSLFASMDIPYPGLPPVNFTALMIPGDTPPPNITEADTAVAAKWWPNGVAHSFKSIPVSDGSDGNGWVQADIVLVRLHQAYAPNGTFGAYAYPDHDYITSAVGYDAAICVEEFKPYVVDAYNNTASAPTTLGLVHRGLDFDQSIYAPQPTTIENGVQWGIDSKGKAPAFRAAYINSRNVMLKDNGRDFYYVPNPTASSTPCLEAFGLCKNRMLPYLAGSQPIVARYYSDKTVAYVSVSMFWLGILLFNMLLLGYVVTIFVPRLPLGLPRRDFGVFSWLAAIEGDAILSIPTGVGRYEHLEELKRRGRDIKVRYTAPNESDWALPETERAHREFFERQYTML
ncbi:exonuclease [Ceratobasidium sp. AG-Ba]|nr:exonuclease [Ceratobasidium sp. AG-Ba]